MKGHIILPEFYRTRWTDDYKYLLAMVAKEFKFKIEYNDNPEIAQDTDVVILFAVPHHMRPNVLANMVDLPKHIKLIGYMKDIQYYDKPEIKAQYEAMFDRYNVILSPHDETMKELYPGHIGKALYFPDFFGPYERYDMPLHPTPVMRCLLAGSVSVDVYPLRQHVLENMEDGYLDFLPSPVFGHDIIGDKYAKLLNSYFCCMACSGIYKGTVAKYFEIPGAGSLLITNRINDLDLLGFVPHEHYVPITKDTACETIKKVLEDPEKYVPIRDAGTQFVRENHSIRNRFEVIKKVINDCVH